jgi:putative aldouronate transport system permease protein
MIGVTIAFQDFSLGDGFFKSSWVGFKHFEKLFTSPDFLPILRNTIVINLYKLLFCFPVPIILALFLNEVSNSHFKRTVQSLTYLPHFFSWVVIAGITVSVFSTSSGLINQLLKSFDMQTIPFMVDKRFFRGILVVTEMWRDAGWGSIIYLAALTSISPELYEAAKIDGASRLRRVVHISLPGISSTIMVLFLLNTGNLLRGGFEQILMLYSVPVYEVADVIPTYVYRLGILDMRYSFATAAGLFQSLVGLMMITISNVMAKRLGGEGLW